MIHSLPRRFARLSRWVGRRRQLTQGKFGSGIAQGHTPILGLPPSPGSDTSATPSLSRRFCVALLLHSNHETEMRRPDGHRGPVCAPYARSLGGSSRRWRDLEEDQPTSNLLPNCLTGPLVVFLGSQPFSCELFCRDQGLTDLPYAIDGLGWRRSRARSAGPTSDFPTPPS